MKILFDWLRKKGVNPKVVLALEYVSDFLHWFVLAYLAVTAYTYFYDYWNKLYSCQYQKLNNRSADKAGAPGNKNKH